jgi:microcystin-dependent protein
MAQPFVGQVIAVGFNFPPSGWFLCNGQLLPISEFQVLFTLIGTTYGGDGVSTFGLPNLNGAVPMGMGTGQGLSTHVQGQFGGSESVTLLSNQIGAHTHPLMTSGSAGTTAVPGPTVVLGQSGFTAASAYITGTSPSINLNPAAIGPAGSSLPHENRQPFVVVNYIISAFGIFPSQS